MFSLVNRVSFPDTKQHPLLTNNPHALVPFLEMEYVDKENLDFTNFTFPRLFSTHLPLSSLSRSVEDSDCKLVYLCRNPKDTVLLALQGVSLYGPFWDHVLGYWKESLERPHRVFFLKYEEMKREPRIQLRRLSEFLGCPFSLEEENSGVLDEILELCSFENLSNLEVNKIGTLKSGQEHQVFFRRGEVGDSMNYLTAEMVEKIDMITEQKLHCHGLKF
ncbi:hypothetical protein H0E87_019202 [Populus deltoides]|uniref:Sulfotransferase n=1 Tax=Populus deltoides TaxID=3696 RepID=A0A8T2XUD1_POPDE|nr:hypothetical protein H0E87_019202 [Populus deltoides]